MKSQRKLRVNSKVMEVFIIRFLLQLEVDVDGDIASAAIDGGLQYLVLFSLLKLGWLVVARFAPLAY